MITPPLGSGREREEDEKVEKKLPPYCLVVEGDKQDFIDQIMGDKSQEIAFLTSRSHELKVIHDNITVHFE